MKVFKIMLIAMFLCGSSAVYAADNQGTAKAKYKVGCNAPDSKGKFRACQNIGKENPRLLRSAR